VVQYLTIESVRNRIRTDYILTFGGLAISQVAVALSGILIARFLGPAAKGDAAAMQWIPSTLAIAGALGLPQAAAFEISRDRISKEAVTLAAIWSSLLVGLVESALVLPFIPWLLALYDHSVVLATCLLVLIALPVQFVHAALLGAAQGMQRFAQYNLLSVVPFIGYLGAGIVLQLGNALSVPSLALSYTLAYLAATLAQLIVGRRRLVRHGKAVWTIARRLLRRGVTFFIPDLIRVLILKVDLLILIRMVASDRVGYYSVAVALSLIPNIVVAALEKVSFPKLAAQSRDLSMTLLVRQFRAAQPVLLIAVSVTALCSPLMIRVLYGAEFMPALAATVLLLVGKIAWGLGRIVDNGLRGVGSTAPGTYANATALCILIAGGIALTRLWGIRGMALAHVLSQLASLAFLVIFLWRSGEVACWKKLHGFRRGWPDDVMLVGDAPNSRDVEGSDMADLSPSWADQDVCR